MELCYNLGEGEELRSVSGMKKKIRNSMSMCTGDIYEMQ
jgi:hypothetical protein